MACFVVTGLPNHEPSSSFCMVELDVWREAGDNRRFLLDRRLDRRVSLISVLGALVGCLVHSKLGIGFASLELEVGPTRSLLGCELEGDSIGSLLGCELEVGPVGSLLGCELEVGPAGSLLYCELEGDSLGSLLGCELEVSSARSLLCCEPMGDSRESLSLCPRS